MRVCLRGAPGPVILIAAVLGLVIAEGCGPFTPLATTSCVANFSGPEVLGAEVPLTDGVTEIAESFMIASATTPANVRIKLKAIGTPTGNLYLKIEGDASGQPNKVVIETTTLSAAAVPAAPAADANYNFIFATPQMLLAGKYWIILYGNSSFSSATGVGVDWMATNVVNAYSGILSSSTNDSTWSTTANTAALFLIGC